MNVPLTKLTQRLPSFEDGAAVFQALWRSLSRLPGGSRVFSRLIGMAAPYTGTIGAHLVELRQGYARAEIADRRAVRNHLSSVHAIALVNLAEMTGSAALAFTVPASARFIITGISADYLAKARGRITATAQCPDFDPGERCEIAIPVELHDADGQLVTRCEVRALVGPRKGLG